MQRMLGNCVEVRGSTPEEWARGALSPDWTELLMGWPMGWTSLDPLTQCRVPTRTAWANGAWEDGVPRVNPKVQNRYRRLKAIGNGQVPQCAVLAWLTLENMGMEVQGD